MDKIKVTKALDAACENFQKDMASFSEDSTAPVTEADLYRLSQMTLNAIWDIKNAIISSL